MRPTCSPARLGGALAFVVLAACGPDDDLNLFTVEDDLQLGADLKLEIDADPAAYPPLDRAAYPEAYANLERIRDAVLSSDDVIHRDDFAWEVTILDDDETLNAFAAPGGYLWVYTGLIRFLKTEDQLTGVLGHEIAHADRRHATEQLTKIYGLSTLIELALGEDPGLVTEIAAGLVSLSFSRAQEAEADDFSVIYLCDTDYAANGAAGFFELIEASAEPPEFLSTHPSSAGRVTDINAKATALGCSVEPNPSADYAAFIGSLP